MDRLPLVAIIGRQNVGKSSLLNAMAGRRISIVDALAGTTRDRVSVQVTSRGRTFELVDTAGVGLDAKSPFSESVERQIRFAIDEADLIVFVVDAIQGVTGEDKDVARRLRKANKPVLLVGNKADTTLQDEELVHLMELGYGEPFAVSAAHRRFVGELLEEIAERLPKSEGETARPIRIAIVGKRNVGKSTLVNALAGQERVVVSEVPGTTRDAVDVRISKGKQSYVLVDTAGLRKRQKVEDSVELFSQVRTREAIDRADAVLLMIDVTEKLSDIDKRIAGMIDEFKRPCVIVLNKWDKVPKSHTPDEFEKYIVKTMPVLQFAPVMMISALKGDRIWDVFKVAGDLVHQSSIAIPTPDLNRVLERAESERSPGTRGAHEPKIYYATQTKTNPPTFLVFVNDPKNFTQDYVRFLENRFRFYMPIKEVPIRMMLKKRIGNAVMRQRNLLKKKSGR